jgi:glycosyltransferase involved in cell wall biosynthesis
MLSIIIPSYREPYLQRTIDDIRANAETDVEIIAVLDGYDDKINNATVLKLNENRGMRNAINQGIAASSGEYILKTDGHCKFDRGFDRKLLETFEDNWVVIPRRYDLNPDTWEVMSTPFIDYDKLIIHKTRYKFHGERWVRRHKEHRPSIDETMCFQGSCWMMKRTWWDKIAPLDEANYGSFVQEPVEISFKTWQAGGKLMVNKNTWYAHKHRDWNRTHNINRDQQEKGNGYAMDTYLQYYNDVIKPKFEL